MNAIERLEYRGTDVTLVADAMGPEDGLPVLFLHGSGQARQSWTRALKEAARRGYRGVTLDMRGHGDSGWSPDGVYGVEKFARDLGVVLTQFDTPPIVVGASLGGLAAMLEEARNPGHMRGLVLVDITAKVEMDGANEVMAFMGSAADGFASLEEAAEAVSAYLPHREKPSDTSGLARNLRLRNGRYYWHWDPAFMTMGKSAAERLEHGNTVLEDAARSLKLPVLLVRGGRSRILSEEGAREFLELVPHADYAPIADAHHMVAGDANDAFNGAVFDFIAKQAALTPAR